MSDKHCILGIDPGSVVAGYGVISIVAGRVTVVEYGAIAAKRRSNSFPQRLREIYTRLSAVIERTSPTACAMEQVFFARNVKSLSQLAHARGVAMLACANAGLEPVEYTPMQVKRSVTGRGAASKQQVQTMVCAMLGIEEINGRFDATDALAVAICHAVNNGRTPKPVSKQGRSRRQAWTDYVNTLNP